MRHPVNVLGLTVWALAFCVHASFAQSVPTELEGRFNESDHLIELRWHAPDGDPSAYGVYRKTSGGASFELLATAQDDRYNDQALQAGASYDYYVTAFYGTQESGPSNAVQVTAAAAADSSGDSSQVTLHITSDPVTAARTGVPYHYDVVAVTNPAGQSVCFELHEAPAGMTIDPASGAIDWTPDGAGRFEVEIRARICSGGDAEAEQRYTVLVFSGAPARVEGTVHNEAGLGLPAVRIRLFDASTGDFLFRTTTDDSGRFAIPSVNPATYFVRANDEAGVYESQWFDGVRHLEEATPVVVAESSTVTLSFKLLLKEADQEDRFVLSGAVTSAATGVPLAARVTAFPVRRDRRLDDDDEFDGEGRDGGDDGGRTDGDRLDKTVSSTDSLGRFDLRLKGGAYILKATAEGFLPKFWDNEASPLEANIVDVHRDTSGFDFALQPRPAGTGSLSGTIRLAADSLPLALHVTGFGQDSLGHLTGFVEATESDSSGHYTLDSLPPGLYIVLAHARGHDLVPTFFTPAGGTPFLDSAAAVSVGSGAVTGIDIFVQNDSADGLDAVEGEIHEEHELAGRPGLAGRFTDALVPLPGTIIVVKDLASGNVVASGVSGADGGYRLAAVAPGSYFLIFQNPGHTSAGVPLTLSYPGSSPATATVNAQLVATGQSGAAGTLSVRQAWNLLSVPFAAAGEAAATLFPGASSQAFSYVPGTGYEASATVQNGKAYWLKFDAAQILLAQGTPRTSQSIEIAEGWNMIGTLSAPVDAGALQASSPGLFASPFYGYDGSYRPSSVLEPGQGYWVKATAGGTITMNAMAGAPKSSHLPAPLEAMNSLTIGDGAQSQTLYFGSAAAGLHTGQFDLPPAAPGGGTFDARFASGSMLETHPAVFNGTRAYPIAVQAGTPSVTVTWSVRDTRARYTLVHGDGSIVLRPGEGSAKISAASAAALRLTATTAEAVPQSFALGQNYPNPFNPSTTIEYSLPEDARVTLKIFNLLGQEVSTVVDAVETAGFKAVRVDAAGIPSGVYFYRLQAGPNTQTRRMLLLK